MNIFLAMMVKGAVLIVFFGTARLLAMALYRVMPAGAYRAVLFDQAGTSRAERRAAVVVFAVFVIVVSAACYVVWRIASA